MLKGNSRLLPFPSFFLSLFINPTPNRTKMEQKPNHRLQIRHIIQRSPSSYSDTVFDSPIHSDHHPPDSTPFASPLTSPNPNPKTIASVPENFTPEPPPQTTVNRAARGDVGGGVGKVEAVVGRVSRGGVVTVGELGFRICEIAFCLVSFSVMASNKTQGWSGDSFDRYKEYRYCLSVNVLGFVFSGLQAYDMGYYLGFGKHALRCHLRLHFNFFIDQIIAYLLISASSSAATRVDDWQSNWGKDEFTIMASASVAMSFLAFISFAISSLISGYNLCNPDLT